MIQFRVTVKKVGGEEIVFEQFEAQSDAESYVKSLTGKEDSLLNDESGVLPAIVTMEELYKGSWIITHKELVTK